MIIELLIFLLVILEATKVYFSYKSLPKETKEEIKSDLPKKEPKLTVFTYKPKQNEEEAILTQTIKKIFNKK